MSRKEKLIKRFLSQPKDFTYQEMVTMLSFLGYEEQTKGKTSGSRVRFHNYDKKSIIDIHRPHPANVIKSATMKDVFEKLVTAKIITF